jgi:hypothetical protein
MALRAHDLPEDLLIEGKRGDSTKERDREAVLGHTYLVLTFLHRSVDAKYYVGVVVGSYGVVMGREGVFCIDGEGGRGGGGGGGGSGGGRRLRRGSGHILLGGLRRKRLHLGRHGGVVVIGGVGDGGDVFGGGGNVVCGGVGVVINALFVVGDFLV